jgi:threonine/homoserine/homoserine lactone efflux protein
MAAGGPVLYDPGMDLFVRGLILGVSIAAPVGPIGLLCIRRTLTHGRWHGLATGLGAASADAIFGLIAALGLTAVSTALADWTVPLQIVGGVLLLVIGVQTMRARPADKPAQVSDGTGLASAYLSALALTLTNPLTIMMFAGLFAGAGLATGPSGLRGIGLVTGVFFGSGAWWLTLTTLVIWLGQRMPAAFLKWINRLSGAALLGFGVWALGTGL